MFATPRIEKLVRYADKLLADLGKDRVEPAAFHHYLASCQEQLPSGCARFLDLRHDCERVVSAYPRAERARCCELHLHMHVGKHCANLDSSSSAHLTTHVST